jgi:hypothetical protein
MKLTPKALALALTGLTAAPAAADVIAVVAVCAKTTKVCSTGNARSVYRIPVQGSICFVPIQQRLAEMGVYDEKKDDIRITCEPKAAG